MAEPVFRIAGLLLLTLALGPHSAFAAIPKRAAKKVDLGLTKLLKADLKERKAASFERILSRWSDTYGSRAVAPLLSIANDRKNSDPDRYVAVMGAAMLGGVSQAPRIKPLLKDKSWMVRTASLRALSALNDPSTSSAVLPLLKDRALVVRLEAVHAVEKLSPPGSIPALAATLNDPANYHAGKSQWIPKRALEVLVSMKAKGIERQIGKLLARNSDPEIQKHAVAALESLSGKKLRPEAPLPRKVEAWRKELSRS